MMMRWGGVGMAGGRDGDMGGVVEAKARGRAGSRGA